MLLLYYNKLNKNEVEKMITKQGEDELRDAIAEMIWQREKAYYKTTRCLDFEGFTATFQCQNPSIN